MRKHHSIARAARIGDRITAHIKAGNNRFQMVSMAPLLAVRDAPAPPLAEFEAWLNDHRVGKNAHSSMDARKLRRAVQMVRNGCNHAEIGRSIGVGGNCVTTWLDKLPPELRP